MTPWNAQPALVRFPIPGQRILFPGMVVRCVEPFLKKYWQSEEEGMVTHPLLPRPVILPRHRLLDFREFLERQPCEHFWAAVLRRTLQHPPLLYIQDVLAEKPGTAPFRFESPGEWQRYAWYRHLRLSDYWLAEFQPPSPVPLAFRHEFIPDTESLSLLSPCPSPLPPRNSAKISRSKPR